MSELQRFFSLSAQLTEIDEKFAEIISYGAGHITSCPIARYQFSLLILFAHHFEVSMTHFLIAGLLHFSIGFYLYYFSSKLFKENTQLHFSGIISRNSSINFSCSLSELFEPIFGFSSQSICL